jgi:hypothetical protein
VIKQKLFQINKKLKIGIVLAITVIANFLMLPLNQVFATTYTTKPIVLLTNMQSSGTSSVIIGWIPGSSGSVLTLGFSNYTGGSAGSVATSQTVSATYNSIACGTILGGAYTSAVEPGTPTAAGNASTGLITFTTATQTATTAYCLVLSSTSAVTNPTTGAVEPVVFSSDTDTSVTVQTDVITNDQIIVSAIVPSTFTMSLSGTSDTLGTLSSGSISGSGGLTVTVGTNAKNGWFLYASDINSGLYSSTQTKYIASVATGSLQTLTSGSEGYDLAVTSASINQGTGSGIGVTSAQTYYASTGSGVGGGLNTVPRIIAQSNGTAVNAQVPIKEYATISNITPAALDYGDTITLVGAGSF